MIVLPGIDEDILLGLSNEGWTALGNLLNRSLYSMLREYMNNKDEADEYTQTLVDLQLGDIIESIRVSDFDPMTVNDIREVELKTVPSASLSALCLKLSANEDKYIPKFPERTRINYNILTRELRKAYELAGSSITGWPSVWNELTPMYYSSHDQPQYLGASAYLSHKDAIHYYIKYNAWAEYKSNNGVTIQEVI